MLKDQWINSSWDSPSYGNAIEEYLKRDVVPSYPLVASNPLVKYKEKPLPKIKKAIFNPPATIIIWDDNTKSVVQCQNGEPFDPEKGFALAYLKKLLGNKNEFNKEIHKWVKYEEPKEEKPKEKAFEWRVVNRHVKVGDYVRIIQVDYDFNELGDILKVHEIVGEASVHVLDKDQPRGTGCNVDSDFKWCYLPSEYEVVEKVEV